LTVIFFNYLFSRNLLKPDPVWTGHTLTMEMSQYRSTFGNERCTLYRRYCSCKIWSFKS